MSDANANAAARPADFRLEPGVDAGEVRSSTGFRHPYAYYTRIYEKGERTLKGWVAVGRDADPQELPPFDDPGAMESWWVRHMKNRPPPILRELAVRGRAGVIATQPAEPAAAGAGAKTDDVGPNPRAKIFELSTPASEVMNSGPAESTGAQGFEAALQRVRREEARMGELVERLDRHALLATDPEEQRRLSAEGRAVRSQLESIRTQLRQYEEKAPSILAAAGRTWVADDVVAAWEAGHAAVASGLRSLYRRLRPKLRACVSVDEEEALWQAEVDRLFSGLLSSKFASQPAAASVAPSDDDLAG